MQYMIFNLGLKSSFKEHSWYNGGKMNTDSITVCMLSVLALIMGLWIYETTLFLGDTFV